MAFDNYDDKTITLETIEAVDMEEIEEWFYFEFQEGGESIRKSLSILTGFYDDLDSQGRKIVNMTMCCMFGWQLTTIYNKALERQAEERTTLEEAQDEINNYCLECGKELDDKEFNFCVDCYHKLNYAGDLEPE